MSRFCPLREGVALARSISWSNDRLAQYHLELYEGDTQKMRVDEVMIDAPDSRVESRWL